MLRGGVLKNPEISIIIPTLNEEKYLPRLLKSIRRQMSKCPFEVIIVDGCSADKTVEVAKGFGVRVIVKRSNIAEARNIGGMRALGRYLLFLDADTVIPQGFIDGLSRLFKAGVRCAIFRPEPLAFTNSLLARFGYTLGWILCRLRLTNPCYMGLAVDKELFKRLGGFDARLTYGEDLDFLWKVSKVVNVHYPKNLFVYNSTRRWLVQGKLLISEVFKAAFRVLEYIVFHRSRAKYPVFR